MNTIEKNNRIVMFCAICFIAHGIIAQNDSTTMNNFNFQRKVLQEYFDKLSIERNGDLSGTGFNDFKRWEWFYSQRVGPDGDYSKMNNALQEYFVQRVNKSSQRVASSTSICTATLSNWQPLGPSVFPTQYPNSKSNGVGRTDAVVFQPGNNNIIYVCTPSAGLWKSTDGGQTWNPSGLSYSLSNKIRTHKIVISTNGDVFFAFNYKTNS